MTQFIAITKTDGGVAVMQFFGDGESDEAITAEIARSGIAAVSWRRISPDDLPRDRTDRDAWRDNGATIAVDATAKTALDQAKAAIRDPVAELDALKATLIDNSVITEAQVAASLPST